MTVLKDTHQDFGTILYVFVRSCAIRCKREVIAVFAGCKMHRTQRAITELRLFTSSCAWMVLNRKIIKKTNVQIGKVHLSIQKQEVAKELNSGLARCVKWALNWVLSHLLALEWFKITMRSHWLFGIVLLIKVRLPDLSWWHYLFVTLQLLIFFLVLC